MKLKNKTLRHTERQMEQMQRTQTTKNSVRDSERARGRRQKRNKAIVMWIDNV